MKLKNKISAAFSIIKIKFFKSKIPLAVSWSLTNRCNFRCKYCTSYKIESKELTTKQVFSVIDEFVKMGAQRVSFSGGEILLREDLKKIISYCKNYGLHVTLTTNGALVSKKIKEIKGTDLLKISFDGPKKIHDFIRQKGSYLDVLKAIEVAKNNNIEVMLNTTLTKYNLDSIEFILETAKRFDITVKFQPVNNICSYSEKHLESLSPEIKEYRKAISKLIILKKSNRHIVNSLKGLKYMYYWPKTKPLKCYAGKIICRIASNGNVYPCTIMENKTKALNCVNLGFKKAFDNLPRVSCRTCWCSSTLELNCLLSFNPETIFNLRKWL